MGNDPPGKRSAIGQGADGRFLPGNSGGGRPKLPDWFKSRGPDALKKLLAYALDDEDVEPELRFKAVSSIVDRVYGKATETREDTVQLTGPALALLTLAGQAEQERAAKAALPPATPTDSDEPDAG